MAECVAERAWITLDGGWFLGSDAEIPMLPAVNREVVAAREVVLSDFKTQG